MYFTYTYLKQFYIQTCPLSSLHFQQPLCGAQPTSKYFAMLTNRFFSKSLVLLKTQGVQSEGRQQLSRCMLNLFKGMFASYANTHSLQNNKQRIYQVGLMCW